MNKLIAALVATTFVMGTAFAQTPAAPAAKTSAVTTAPAAETKAAAPAPEAKTMTPAGEKKVAKHGKHKKAKKAETTEAAPAK